MSIQEALKLLRSEIGYTQEELANEIEKTFLTVNRWENGKSVPSRLNARKIISTAKFHKVSEQCLEYLNDALLPNCKRTVSAAKNGFPNIDRDFLFRIADNSEAGMYVIDASNFNLLYINKKANEMATVNGNAKEKSIDGILDKKCYEFFAGQEKQCLFCPLHNAMQNGITDTYITSPYSNLTYRIHIKTDIVNGRPAYVVYLTDVTDIATERSALYELTNFIPYSVGIYNVYKDGRIELTFMNELLCKMIGSDTSEQLLNSNDNNFSLIEKNDVRRLRREISNAVNGKRNIDIVFRMKINDGTYHSISLNGRIINMDKEKTSFFCVFREFRRNGEFK